MRPGDMYRSHGFEPADPQEIIERDAMSFRPPVYEQSESEDELMMEKEKAQRKQEEEDKNNLLIEEQERIKRQKAVLAEPILKPDTGSVSHASNVKPKPKIEYHRVYNIRALPKHAKTYRLETFKKNAMIIFNHENLEGFSKRNGTSEDVAALTKTFSKFGFEIAVHNDLTKVQLFEELEKFSNMDFTEYGCVAVVILTHGTGNGLLRARDEGQIYSEMDVINQFKVTNRPTLITKPVLLMIQACRGKASTRGVRVNTQLRIDTDIDEEDSMSYYLPVESDMMIVHSSFAGKPSFRNYINEHPRDEFAKRLLSLADVRGMNETKAKDTLTAISHYLRKMSSYHKYIHYYGDDEDFGAMDNEDTITIRYLDRVKKTWQRLCQNQTINVFGGVFIGAYSVYCYYYSNMGN